MENYLVEATNRAQSIINDLCTSDTFVQFLESKLSTETNKLYQKWYENDSDNGNDSLWYANGMTRLVVGDYHHDDYVIKFQTDFDEYEQIDYNENEYKVYRRAIDDGLENMFAWNDYVIVSLPNGNPIKVFVMKYYQTNEDEMEARCTDYLYNLFCDENGYNPDQLSEEEQEEWESSDSYEDAGCSEGMIQYAAAVLDHYSDFYTWGHIMDFIDDTYLNCSSDWHCGNWGFSGSDIVLIDYAGYHTKISD